MSDWGLRMSNSPPNSRLSYLVAGFLWGSLFGAWVVGVIAIALS